MPHYTDPKRYWFTERGRIGFVEQGSATTVDSVVTTILSISEAKSVRIKGIATAKHFTTDASRDESSVPLIKTEMDNVTAGPLDEIPTQFHETLVYKVIAMGYKDPRNLEIQLAQYFDLEYNNGVKNAKKYARSNYATTGTIVPQDY